MKDKVKKMCTKCKKIKLISSYSGKCSSCLNPNARAMGKLSAEARKKIHKSSHYRMLGIKSAEAKRKAKALE